MSIDPGWVRVLGLLVPVGATVGLWAWRRPDRRAAAGVLLGCLWMLPPLVGFNLLAPNMGWWRFQVEGAMLGGMPADLLFGWVFLWGAIPALAAPRMHVAWLVLAAFVFDLLVMPLCVPVVQLDARWMLGEALILTFGLVPAVMLARWTARGVNLYGRNLLQAVCFCGLVLGVLPAVLMAHAGESWNVLLASPWQTLCVWLQLMMIPAVMGLSAVQEFARRGGGTPLPFDPPNRLVTSGPYAYISNPMQACTLALLGLWGLALESTTTLLAGLMVLVFAVGLASWHQKQELDARFGALWRGWRQHVHAFWPRWRPWVPHQATLYLDEHCGKCASLGRWLSARHPVGLGIVAAADHAQRDLNRATYDAGDGSIEEEGIAAVARALEHINLAWAWFGWCARLPIVMAVLQCMVDASGGGPHRVQRRVNAAGSDSVSNGGSN